MSDLGHSFIRFARKADNLPALALVWTPRALLTRLPFLFAGLSRCFSLPLAVGILEIALLCERCRNAAVTKIFDRDQPAVLTALDAQSITNIYMSARFDPAAVELNFAALDRLARRCAGFEKPRRPQPLVDPNVRISLPASWH